MKDEIDGMEAKISMQLFFALEDIYFTNSNADDKEKYEKISYDKQVDFLKSRCFFYH